ncbi:MULTISPECIES: ABC transporter substrate binding protein [unclassified Bradyrhizobium]
MLVPNLTRLGMIAFRERDVKMSQTRLEHNALKKAASQLGFAVLRCDLERPGREGLDDAVASGTRDGVDAFYLSGSFVTLGDIPQTVSSVAKPGGPICSVYRDFVQAGSLMSYSINLEYGFQLAGRQVAKILRGAKPGDLPVERADKFTLAINLNTAKTLGLTVPDRFLLPADEVIQ